MRSRSSVWIASTPTRAAPLADALRVAAAAPCGAAPRDASSPPAPPDAARSRVASRRSLARGSACFRRALIAPPISSVHGSSGHGSSVRDSPVPVRAAPYGGTRFHVLTAFRGGRRIATTYLYTTCRQRECTRGYPRSSNRPGDDRRRNARRLADAPARRPGLPDVGVRTATERAPRPHGRAGARRHGDHHTRKHLLPVRLRFPRPLLVPSHGGATRRRT